MLKLMVTIASLVLIIAATAGRAEELEFDPWHFESTPDHMNQWCVDLDSIPTDDTAGLNRLHVNATKDEYMEAVSTLTLEVVPKFFASYMSKLKELTRKDDMTGTDVEEYFKLKIRYLFTLYARNALMLKDKGRESIMLYNINLFALKSMLRKCYAVFRLDTSEQLPWDQYVEEAGCRRRGMMPGAISSDEEADKVQAALHATGYFETEIWTAHYSKNGKHYLHFTKSSLDDHYHNDTSASTAQKAKFIKTHDEREIHLTMMTLADTSESRPYLCQFYAVQGHPIPADDSNYATFP